VFDRQAAPASPPARPVLSLRDTDRIYRNADFLPALKTIRCILRKVSGVLWGNAVMAGSIASRRVAGGRATCRSETAAPASGTRRGAEPPPERPADDLPHAIRRAAGLVGFHGETVALPSPARATAAARAFAAGNGYLSGLIVDRLA